MKTMRVAVCAALGAFGMGCSHAERDVVWFVAAPHKSVSVVPLVAGGKGTRTAADGYFVLSLRSGSEHEMKVEAEGYAEASVSPFTVAAASVTHMEIGMR